MAVQCPKLRLQREMTCSICQDYFKDPYTVDCGHNFCQACISRYLVESIEATCPQCRAPIQPQNFTPNRDVVRFVEIVKQMSRRRDWEVGNRPSCKIHQLPIGYFCKTDQVYICWVCKKSGSHKGHATIPLEETTLELKELFFNCLDHVRQDRDNATNYKNRTEMEQHNLQFQVTKGMENIATAFRVIREFLAKAELLVSNEASRLETEVGKIMEDNMSRASEKLSSFENILEKMEEMSQLSEDQFLQSDRKTLEKWAKERFDKSVAFPSELKWRIWELCDLHYFLVVLVDRIQRKFDAGFRIHYDKVNVTLDPSTAHPKLYVSQDCKTVRWSHHDHAYSDNPRRFTDCTCVLGSQGFSSGKFYWDVDIGLQGSWAIGVAKESVECKGELALNSWRGIYAVGKSGDKYFAFEQTNLPFPWKPLKPMRIRISVDYTGAGVVFSDAEEAVQLFEFREKSFDKEKLYPFFWIQWEGQLKISS